MRRLLDGILSRTRGEPRVALLIDGENLGAPLAEDLVRLAQEMGRPTVLRVYGDWARPQMGPWRTAARRNGIRLAQATRFDRSKDVLDIHLALGAMDLLHEGEVEAFLIATGDGDLLPLVDRLREAGCRVEVAGGRATAMRLQAAADAFHRLDADHELPSGHVDPLLDTLMAAFDAVKEAPSQGEPGVVVADLAAMAERWQLLPGSGAYEDHGARRFKDLIQRFPDRFRLAIEDRGAGQRPVVHLIDPSDHEA